LAWTFSSPITLPLMWNICAIRWIWRIRRCRMRLTTMKRTSTQPRSVPNSTSDALPPLPVTAINRWQRRHLFSIRKRRTLLAGTGSVIVRHADQHFVHPVAVHVHHFKTQMLHREHITGTRHAVEERQNETAQTVIAGAFLVRQF